MSSDFCTTIMLSAEIPSWQNSVFLESATYCSVLQSHSLQICMPASAFIASFFVLMQVVLASS